MAGGWFFAALISAHSLAWFALLLMNINYRVNGNIFRFQGVSGVSEESAITTLASINEYRILFIASILVASLTFSTVSSEV